MGQRKSEEAGSKQVQPHHFRDVISHARENAVSARGSVGGHRFGSRHSSDNVTKTTRTTDNVFRLGHVTEKIRV